MLAEGARLREKPVLTVRGPCIKCNKVKCALELFANYRSPNYQECTPIPAIMASAGSGLHRQTELIKD